MLNLVVLSSVSALQPNTLVGGSVAFITSLPPPGYCITVNSTDVVFYKIDY